MTTKVLIANHGPDPIVVIVATGVGLANPQIPKPEECQRVEVSPLTFCEVYVHPQQSCMVLEQRRESDDALSERNS